MEPGQAPAKRRVFPYRENTYPRPVMCPLCAAPVTRHGGRGRPPRYCSTRCRWRAQSAARAAKRTEEARRFWAELGVVVPDPIKHPLP